MNRLEDAKDISKAKMVCKDWRDAGNKIRSLRIVCLDVYHERARENRVDLSSSKSAGSSSGSSTSSSSQAGRYENHFVFKDQVVKIVEPMSEIVQLRIEVEPKLQSKTVPEGERRRTDFWLVDPYFLRLWLPKMGSTLQHLCIVDYGQQAIMRRSSIIKILSKCCEYTFQLSFPIIFWKIKISG